MPLTVKEILTDAIARLKKAGVSEPENSARLLLQFVLHQKTSGLHLAARDAVSDDDFAQFNKLVDRRCDHEPVQYLVGEVEFYNVKLKADRRALIPRPETEELVDHLIAYIGIKENLKALDIGTGSGNIAIALAANVSNSEITAVDISEDALKLARENAALNDVDGRINFIHDDCLQERFWSEIGRFDVVVSNPPYVEAAVFDSLQPDVRLYEPSIALVTNREVLIFYKTIVAHAAEVLNPGGLLCFEIGIGQAEEVARIIEGNLPSCEIEVKKDLSGIPRIVLARLIS